MSDSFSLNTITSSDVAAVLSTTAMKSVKFEEDEEEDEELEAEIQVKSAILPTMRTALRMTRRSTMLECAHSFVEHTYTSPTHCQVCNGLLVGLWSQGFQCRACGMDVHRGQGLGEHDHCKAEALLMPCPGHKGENKERSQKKEEANLSGVVTQMLRDVKAKAKETIVAAGVEEERTKNLRRIKTKLVPFIEKLDAVAANGELHVQIVLLILQAWVALIHSSITMVAFVVFLAPRHGILSATSIRLAAVHDATVSVAISVYLAIFASIVHYLGRLMKRKATIIDRFIRDTFDIDAEVDIGVSVLGVAKRTKAWSKRIFISLVVGQMISILFWYRMQPKSWESTDLPPIANMAMPVTFLMVCSGFVAAVSYWNLGTTLVEIEEYVDIKVRG